MVGVCSIMDTSLMPARTPVSLTPLVVRLYAKLRSTPKVGKRLNLSHCTIRRILNRAGMTLPGPQSREVLDWRSRFRGNEAKSVVRDYKSGISMLAIRRKYRCSRWAVHTAVRKAGATLRAPYGARKKWTKAQQRKMCSLYKKGWAQQHIAVELDTNQRSVVFFLEANGIKGSRGPARGERHPHWKGGRTMDGNGYSLCKFDPMDTIVAPMASISSSYILEHRMVMARSLGRPLKRSESVHHINGKKTDNRIENLQLRTGKHGKGVVAVCADCGSNHIAYQRLN